MNSNQAAVSNGTAPSKSYRGTERPAPPRSKTASTAPSPPIRYRFNPVPHALHAPAYMRPTLNAFDKAIEQSICALILRARAGAEGLTLSLAQIVEHSGVSLSTVSRSIPRLRDAGSIVTSQIWLPAKPGKPRRYLYHFQLPAMNGGDAGPIPRPSGTPPEPSHVSLTCQGEVPSLELLIDKDPLPPINVYVSPTRARANARDDEPDAYARENNFTPIDSLASVTGAEPTQTPAPKSTEAEPRRCGVVDWEPEADFSDKLDTHPAPFAPEPVTLEKHLLTREVLEFPGGAEGPPLAAADIAPAADSERLRGLQSGSASTNAAKMASTEPLFHEKAGLAPLAAADRGKLAGAVTVPATSPAQQRRHDIPPALRASGPARAQAFAEGCALDQAELDERNKLAVRLRKWGVWEHGIHRILSLRTPEEIAEALDEVAERREEVWNGAGWLYGHLVNYWDEIQAAKDAAAKAAEPSPAEKVKAREKAAAAAMPTTTAEWDAARAAKRAREEAQERAERAKREAEGAKQLDRLQALPREEYDALYAQVLAKFKGKPRLEAIMRGEMLFILDQRDQQRRRE